MKKLILFLALATPVIAQVTPTTPSAFETKGLGSGASVGATVTPAAAKPKPLAAGDKKFVKDALDGMFYVMELSGQAKNNAQTEAVKKLSAGLKTDFDKVWADVGGFASDRGEKIPTELAGSDKGKAERLGKSGDKFDKEFTKLVTKEVEKLAKVFEAAGKGQDVTIKELSTKWTATMKDQANKADAAEKEVAKSK